MDSLNNYLCYKNDIRNAALIIEHKSSEKILYDLCANLKLDNIYLYSTSKETLYNAKSYLSKKAQLSGVSIPTIQAHTYIKKIKFETPLQIDLVLFDSDVRQDAILSSLHAAPTYLVGRVWRDFVPCFNIWEQARSVCSHIYIEDMIPAGKIDVLKWDRNPCTDIELSIVFPVYNVAKYLEKCITTVTAWKAPYIEFLFVNDGSPDNSRDIIQQYQKKDPRIKIIDKPNGGCASARKKGLECASGKYVGFIDPDDFIDEDMFRLLLSRAIMGNYDICYSGYNAYYENSGHTERVDEALNWPYCNGTTNRNEILQLFIYTRTAIWRGIYLTSFLRDNHITFQENIKRFDDLPFKLETLAKARSVVSVPQYLYYYRLERPGQDVSCDDERLYVHFDIFKHLNQTFGELQNQKIFDLLQMSKVQAHCFVLRKIQKKFVKEYCKQARNDFKANGMTIKRTLILMYRYFRFDNMLAYLSIMFGFPNAYIRHLERKRIR